jgi:hypothetical protein
MRIAVVATLLLALASTAQAATSITVDGRLNCIQSALSPGAAPYGTAATFQLAPGRYVMSLSANTMSCSPGGCAISSVTVQGGVLTAKWGVPVTTQPIVVDVGGNSAATLYGYVSDDVCSDNGGQATLLIQQAY